MLILAFAAAGEPCPSWDTGALRKRFCRLSALGSSTSTDWSYAIATSLIS